MAPLAMPRYSSSGSSSNRDGAPHSRRKSLFALSALTQINPVKEESASPTSRTLRKKKAPSIFTNIQYPDVLSDDALTPTPTSATSTSASPRRRPSISMRGSVNRASSVFGSLRSMRSLPGDDAPLTATSSKSLSVNWGDYEGVSGNPKAVLRHGEVQTSSGMFRKKKEYLVLTETHIVRCKSQGKAAETFSGSVNVILLLLAVRERLTYGLGYYQRLVEVPPSVILLHTHPALHKTCNPSIPTRPVIKTGECR